MRRRAKPLVRERKYIYVLSWYGDGSGEPELRHFLATDGLAASLYAAEKKDEGRMIEIAYVTTNAPKRSAIAEAKPCRAKA